MPKIEIEDVLKTNHLPTITALKRSFGEKDFALIEKALKENRDSEKATALIKLGKVFENRENQGIGYSKTYKTLLCYSLATIFQDLNAHKAIQLVIRKEWYYYDFYDPRFATILELSCQKEKELKALLTHARKEEKSGDSQLDTLLAKVNSFEQIILAERLDLAFEVYKHCHALLNNKENHDYSRIEKIQQAAFKLMEVILNVEGEEKVLHQMNKRLIKRKWDPEFIPGKRPHLTQLPSPYRAVRKSQYQWRRLAELALSHKRGKILAVKPERRARDLEDKIQMLTSQERDKHRVIIQKGKFYERQPDNTYVTCDTWDRVSHRKTAFAAFTLNMKGELSLFDHFDSDDGFAHSSMNASSPIFISGEIQLVQGELRGLTVYSLHYNPTLANIYELLSYFQAQGVDTSKTTLYTWGPDNRYTGNDFIKYNAKEFFEQFKLSGMNELKSVPSLVSTTEISLQNSLDSELKQVEADDFEVDWNAHLPSHAEVKQEDSLKPKSPKQNTTKSLYNTNHTHFSTSDKTKIPLSLAHKKSGRQPK